ncbi:MAG TPA: helix-hairpin-helix domain-containing protein [Methanocella sp.]|nr:helix-hairpin-helix domain-containing protein [Methanocella sp.]
MNVIELTGYPGIGEKIAAKLVDHFGSEERAAEVLYRRDAASLAEVPGIGEKYAISMVHQIIAYQEGVSVDDFLQTPEAMNVYERIIGLVRSYAHTPYSRSRISTYIPYPSSKVDRVKSTQTLLKEYIPLAKELSADAMLNGILKKIRYLKRPASVQKSRDRAVVVDNKKDYEGILSQQIDRYMEIYQVANPGELVDLARGYAQILVVGSRLAGADYPEELSLEFADNPGDLWWLVPEITIGYFAANKEPVEAALETIRIIRNKSDFPLCPDMDDAKICDLSAELAHVGPDGELAPGVDDELDRLKNILKRFNEILQATVKKANENLTGRMENNTITIKGSQLLGMFGSGSDSLKSLVEKEVAKNYSEVIAEAKENLKIQLSLKPFEMQHIDLIFRDEINYPIEINYRGVEGFRNAINRQMIRRSLDMKRASAKRLVKYEALCRNMIRDVLDFDTYYAIGLFAAEYDLKMPKLAKKPGIVIANGRNIFLGNRNVEPVSYAVGVKVPETMGERIVLLSGVNSGGKTTMLDMIAQTIILSHMGFPVPADQADIGIIDQLLYFSKSKGTLTAGAFETTIRNFARVINDGNKMVLVDELESITEPGASARIIAGILETLYENDGSTAIFVSHLAEQIMENTKCPIRVDGIEAKGLDENLNLIVDRTPRYNYLAKSTPELIVERLTRSSAGDQKAFYGRLLTKFKGRVSR